jgi:hypothetical protein
MYVDNIIRARGHTEVAPINVYRKRQTKVIVQTNLGKVPFLADTGAAGSFLIKEFRRATAFVAHERDTVYRTINGGQLRQLGTLRVKLVIEGRVYEHNFVVADVTLNVLGFDFMEENLIAVLPKPTRLCCVEHLTEPDSVIAGIGEDQPLSAKPLVPQADPRVSALRSEFPYVFGDLKDPNRPVKETDRLSCSACRLYTQVENHSYGFRWAFANDA